MGTSGPYFDWTEARIAELRELWVDKGWSTRRIAEHFGGGLTRNAVIGKVHRMGWQRVQLSAEVVEKRKRARARRLGEAAVAMDITMAELKRVRQAKRERAQVRKPPPPKPEWAPPVRRLPVRPAGEPVDLLHLEFDDCRWIIGEVDGPRTLFCASPKVEGSYCATHARLAYSGARNATVRTA